MMLVRTAALALALVAAGAMAAEDIYRSTMPDGSIRYGEAPDPGAKSSKKVPGPPAATGVTVVTPQEKGRQFTVAPGGTTVIPPPERPASGPIGQDVGTLTAPGQMPRRSY